jgi:hypothetical protein
MAIFAITVTAIFAITAIFAVTVIILAAIIVMMGKVYSGRGLLGGETVRAAKSLKVLTLKKFAFPMRSTR